MKESNLLERIFYICPTLLRPRRLETETVERFRRGWYGSGPLTVCTNRPFDLSIL